MASFLAHVALLVREYDEAIHFYTDCLGFQLVADTSLGDGKRWVLVAPPGPGSSALLLARADQPEQQELVGRQGGSRVWLFLHTDDFARDYQRMCQRAVHFCETPRQEVYGTVAVFEDLYGNRWDLLQPADLQAVA